jgi:hypothetical protein
MMGTHGDRGIIPRLGQAIFDRIENEVQKQMNNQSSEENSDNEAINNALSILSC